ncbi:hypothetical protein [Arenibaculum pallidiluteum]|uniref:hypothetical protein n=1 Tax=Arenibaculum pallidiluteum TaxID=2812559 RepID=UPI001A976961|nr:hypothetical protein [Arenibaculum pallidiluteum]
MSGAQPGERNIAPYRLLAMAAGAGALYLLILAFPAAPCWSLPVLTGLAAVPIWINRRERALMERQALLDGLMLEASGIRQWLRQGRVLGALQALKALALAVVLFAGAGALGPWHLAALGGSTLFLALAAGPAERLLAGHLRPDRLGTTARGWILPAANLAVLAPAFFAIDFLIAGAPDTRGLAWHGVAEDAFAAATAASACGLAGMLSGIFAAADALAWHVYQGLVPALPGTGARIAAGLLFLLKAGIVAWIYTCFQLGVGALAARRRGAPEGGSAPWGVFAAVVLAFAAPILLAASLVRDLGPAAFPPGLREVASWMDPCRPDGRAMAALRSDMATEIAAAQDVARREVLLAVERDLDALFSGAEAGIERYLDWHFSLRGEYQRLAALATGSLAESMAQRLDGHLFGPAGFQTGLERMDHAIATGAQAVMAGLPQRLGSRASARAGAAGCRLHRLDLPALAGLERDLPRLAGVAGTTAALVAGGGVAAKVLSARVAARRGAQAALGVASRTAGRAAARTGGSALMSAAGAAAACAPGGPAAMLCGLLAGAAAWLGTDMAFIEIDEALHRAAMREELLAALHDQRQALAEALRLRHLAALDRMAQEIDLRVERVFLPVRDAL